MAAGTLALILLGGVLAGLLLYWQLVTAEGAYLGTRVVTLLYDVVAHRYDNIKEYNPEFERLFLGRPLVDALRDMPAPHILDVGTGTARLPLALLEQPAFNGRIVALDASRRMVRQAARKLESFPGRVDLLWQAARHLPFDDNTFDAVTCLEMLEFTPDPHAQLVELVRVLRPGGLLLTTRRRGLDARLMPGKTYSRESMLDLLARLGLEQVRIMPWQMDYDLVWALCRGADASHWRGARPLTEVLHCPACDAVSLVPDSDQLRCETCAARVFVREGVVELAKHNLSPD